ncbi:death-associated inhibitor of apoptosis 1-like, partial [Aphis craccivora]
MIDIAKAGRPSVKYEVGPTVLVGHSVAEQEFSEFVVSIMIVYICMFCALSSREITKFQGDLVPTNLFALPCNTDLLKPIIQFSQLSLYSTIVQSGSVFFYQNFQQFNNNFCSLVLLVRNNVHPAYPEFTTFLSRLKTFNLFPLTSSQDKYSLAGSGFIHSGKKDVVECFCCGLILHHWEKEDNPWIEHSRWNPKCVF